jgi:hypothetical protein
MHKSLVTTLAALIAVLALYTSSAQAGPKIRFGIGFGGPMIGVGIGHGHGHGGGYEKYEHRKRYIERRKYKKVHVAKEKPRKSESKPTKVVRSQPKAEKPVKVAAAPVEEVTADNENSSITAPADLPIEKTALSTTETGAVPATEKAVKSAGKLDCKKFFPTVGMTLSVPCE